MTQKSKAVDALYEYFEEKGRVLTAQEYSRERDTPIRYRVLMNMFGTWGRMEKIIMARREAPEAITDVDDILAKRNKELADQEAAWKAASENQDKKAAREAQAHAVAEKLAANAATAAGANANKLAIGGPLPGEQPKFERLGTPVNIDPVTGEREIVDPEPELVEGSEGAASGKTPHELKEAAKAGELDVENTGSDVKTGDDTSGGSQGSVSIASANAGPDPKTAEKKDDKASDKK